MAPRGGPRTKGRYRTKPPAKPWWRRTAKTAAKALAEIGINQLKKKLGLNTEQKNYDLTGGGTVGSTLASLVDPVTGLAQGNTNLTRNGNGLRVTHITFRGNVSSNSAITGDTQVRLIVTYQPALTTAGTVVTAAQLLQSPSNINSPYNTDLEGVKIIKDQIFVLKAGGYATCTSTKRMHIKIDPSYNDGHVQWTDADTTGANANLVKGFYRIWMMCDQIVGNAPSAYYYTRVHFVDN